MWPATKRLKLSGNEKENANLNAESGFHSQVTFSSTSSFDLSHPRRKSYCPASLRGSYKQHSLSDSHQLSSGYGSSFSVTGSSSDALASALLSPAKTRKRKSEVSESDENFYNSYEFVSPLKIRKCEDKNRAKLILKEKCPSANVILSSTPKHEGQRANKWGKFRSFHPEKFQAVKTLEDSGPIAPPATVKDASSFNFSSFNLSSASFIQDIPENVHNLWTGDIKQDQKAETVTSKTQEQPQVRIEKTPERQFFNGRTRMDILGMLHASNDIAYEEILSYMDNKALLALSHVSVSYRQIITSNKSYETKRKNYLKHHRSILENKYPNCNVSKQRMSSQGEKKAFGNSNLNHMSLRQRPVTPPQSPQRNNSSQQRVYASKKCPRCRKLAVIKKIPIRSSPRKSRKKKFGSSLSILDLSAHGRISKRSASKQLLSKTSIQVESYEVSRKICQTMPLIFDEEKSSSSSGCESPGNCSGSDDPNDEIYEFAECTGLGCCFKFCVKCNCKFHPRSLCAELSPPSPSRVPKVAAACTKSSIKSLKRLFNN